MKKDIASYIINKFLGNRTYNRSGETSSLPIKKWLLIGAGLVTVFCITVVGILIWLTTSLLPALLPSKDSLAAGYSAAEKVYSRELPKITQVVPEVCRVNAQKLLDKSLAMNISGLLFDGPRLLSECFFPKQKTNYNKNT